MEKDHQSERSGKTLFFVPYNLPQILTIKNLVVVIIVYAYIKIISVILFILFFPKTKVIMAAVRPQNNSFAKFELKIIWGARKKWQSPES